MKIHSSVLTSHDIAVAANIAGVYGEVVQVGSRSRTRGFLVRLEALEKDELHRFRANPGTSWPNRSYEQGIAATWDEWGIWIDRLFAIDPDAVIGQYDGQEAFMDQTRHFVDYCLDAHKPDSIYARTHTAPWLASVAA